MTTRGRAIRRLVSCYENMLSIMSEADRRMLAEIEEVESSPRSLPDDEDQAEAICQ